MSDLILYAPREQINDATRYYLQTLSAAAEKRGRRVRHCESLRDASRTAEFLVIECKSAFKLIASRPRARFWLWMQGIVPEEALMQFGSRWRQLLWTGFEWASLRRASGVVVVSEAMRTHLSSKYRLPLTNSFVMPCVNASICEASFHFPNKYAAPTFVYAGGLQSWQCFERTLEVMTRIQIRLPEASLTVLTAEQARASELAARFGVKNFSVTRVPMEQLPEVLARFKYGFVLREDHIVNRVATPTKVSSYMGSGVIPIMTTAVEDYTSRLASVAPMALARSLGVDEVVNAVLDVEKQHWTAESVLSSYRHVFATYFDHAGYMDGLTAFLDETGMLAK